MNKVLHLFGEGTIGFDNRDRHTTRYAYDKNGNMLTLKRKGLQDDGGYSLIDDVAMQYDGNRLSRATDDVDGPFYAGAWHFRDGADAVEEYEYDENGNMTKDLNSNISLVEYNSLNLPSRIEFMDGSSTRYTYDATGRKLRAEYLKAGTQDTLRTDYCGNLIYEQGRPEMLLVDGGYVTFNSNDSLSFGEGWGGVSYHYYLTDHLGNNRVVVNSNDSIEQVNHYYPYGGLMAESTGGDAQRYKYNGKELDRMHGLDWYDYGARWMNGLTFTTPDPKAWDYTDVSPYVYCMNNPIKLIDPTGMIWENPKDAENLKSRIDNKIESINKDNTKLQAKIDKGGLSNKKLAKLRNRLAENNERINNLNQSKADIDLLGEDNNTYVFSNINGGEHHVRLGDDQKVYIETSSDALSIHEITHVRQSLVAGGLKFSKGGRLLNIGSPNNYPLISKAEVEAYQMQYSYDKSFPGTVSSLSDIDIRTVGNIRKENGEPVYQQINAYNIYQKEQERILKK